MEDLILTDSCCENGKGAIVLRYFPNLRQRMTLPLSAISSDADFDVTRWADHYTGEQLKMRSSRQPDGKKSKKKSSGVNKKSANADTKKHKKVVKKRHLDLDMARSCYL